MRDVLTREAKNQSLQSNLVSPRWSFSDQSFVFSFIGSSSSFSCFFSRSVSGSILLSLNFIFKDKYSFPFYFLSLSLPLSCTTLIVQRCYIKRTQVHRAHFVSKSGISEKEKQLNSFIRKSSQYKSPISLTSFFFLCSPLPFPLLSFLPSWLFQLKRKEEREGNK